MDNSHTPPTKPPPLYEAQKKVYPQRTTGTFQRIKSITLKVLLVMYYVTPWVRWDRGADLPNQAILADISGSRLYFYNVEIWPQDIFYLSALLVLAAVGLFFATAIAGRVWCGFTCPQTVWTDLFVQVERFFEGDRNRRIKRDQGPLTIDKIKRKAATHAVWILLALATGATWVFYFTDAPTALVDMATGRASYAVYGFSALFAGTTYLFAGWAREQICTYMCPWPRFQGAMFDEDSLIVTYEAWRGEPRGKVTDDPNVGDCVDCQLCVNVCPVGIDIRDGQQLECIGCALCVDACNEVMKNLGRPGNLIAYDSISNQVARKNNKPTKTRLIRTRTIAYAVFLGVVTFMMVYGLATRRDLDVSVLRDRSPLFVALSNGDIQNGYTFKLVNMRNVPRTFAMNISALPGARVSVIGITNKPVKTVTLSVGPDRVGTFRIFVRAPRRNLGKQFNDLNFVLKAADSGETIIFNSKFTGPVNQTEKRK